MKRSWLIWLVLALALVVFAILMSGGTVWAFLHIPSFLLVVLMSLFLSLINHGFREIGKSFQVAFSGNTENEAELESALLFFDGLRRYFLISGLIGTFIGGKSMLQTLEDSSSIGPNVSLAVLSFFYGLLFYICVAVPLVTGLKKKLLGLSS